MVQVQQVRINHKYKSVPLQLHVYLHHLFLFSLELLLIFNKSAMMNSTLKSGHIGDTIKINVRADGESIYYIFFI